MVCQQFYLEKERKEYHAKPRKWKKANPAPHSCVNCKHLSGTKVFPKCLGVKGRHFPRCGMAIYYPNICDKWETIE